MAAGLLLPIADETSVDEALRRRRAAPPPVACRAGPCRRRCRGHRASRRESWARRERRLPLVAPRAGHRSGRRRAPLAPRRRTGPNLADDERERLGFDQLGPPPAALTKSRTPAPQRGTSSARSASALTLSIRRNSSSSSQAGSSDVSDTGGTEFRSNADCRSRGCRRRLAGGLAPARPSCGHPSVRTRARRPRRRVVAGEACRHRPARARRQGAGRASAEDGSTGDGRRDRP